MNLQSMDCASLTTNTASQAMVSCRFVFHRRHPAKTELKARIPARIPTCSLLRVITKKMAEFLPLQPNILATRKEKIFKLVEKLAPIFSRYGNE